MENSIKYLKKNGGFLSSEVRDHDTKALSDRPELQLKLVQIFFRHGARTPIRLTPGVEEVTWDKDIIFDEEDHLKCDYEVFSLDDKLGPHHSNIEQFYQQGVFKGGAHRGQLTSLGMRQSYELGMCFRRHYMDEVKFLPTEFLSEHVFLRSTNINRNLKSLSCVLAAMYGETLKKNENGLPRVHIDHSSTEILYPNYTHSKPLMEIYYKTFKNTDIVPGVRPIRLQVQELLNQDKEDFHLDLVSVRDGLSACLAHDFPVAPILLPLASEIEKAAVNIMKHSIGCTEAHQEVLPYSIGPLLTMILDNMDKVLKGESQRKLYLFACHDTTLIPLMTALGVHDDAWPGLSADVTLEMYQDSSKATYVRSLYLGKEVKMGPKGLTVIPLEEFQDLLAPMLLNLDDFRKSLVNIETF